MFRSVTFVISLLVWSLSSRARVPEFGETSTHYWQKIPYQQCIGAYHGGKVELKKIIDVSWEKFLKKVQQTNSQSIFSFDMTDEQIELAKKEAEKAHDNVRLGNKFIEILDARRTNELDLTEFLPDAFVFFAGVKGSAALGVKAGVGGVIGAVVMPYCYREVDKQTKKETDAWWDVELEYIGWSGPSIGIGIGGGLHWRAGAGAIWSYSKDFDSPDKFNGLYVGPSCNLASGVGVNVKGGIVKKLNTLNFPDFAMVTLAWDSGLVAEAACNLNTYGILPSSQLLGMFNDVLQARIQDENQQMREVIRDTLNEVLKKPEVSEEAAQKLN